MQEVIFLALGESKERETLFYQRRLPFEDCPTFRSLLLKFAITNFTYLQ